MRIMKPAVKIPGSGPSAVEEFLGDLRHAEDVARAHRVGQVPAESFFRRDVQLGNVPGCVTRVLQKPRQWYYFGQVCEVMLGVRVPILAIGMIVQAAEDNGPAGATACCRAERV